MANLNVKNLSGPDKISVKMAANIIETHLINIINALPNNDFSIVPQICSSKTYFQSKGERTETKNLRLERTLSCFSKIYEKFFIIIE